MPNTKAVRYTVSALGWGYVEERAKHGIVWTHERTEALEFSSFREATEMLRAWKRVKGFPSHAGVTPGLYAEVDRA